MIPYGIKIVSDYLRSHASVTAITNRIVSHPPENTETPWVWVVQVDGANSPNSIPDHLIDFLFDFHCYADKPNPPIYAGGGMPQSNLLGRTVRAALAGMSGVYGGATVSGVKIIGDRPMIDTDLKPVRDRQIVSAQIWMHS